VINPVHHVVSLAADFDLGSFDCGEAPYNDWLSRHASASVKAGVCAVYLLIERSQDRERVARYFAINPTQVAREQAPLSPSRGWPLSVPAWNLGKLAVHVDLRADKDAQWGRQLLREALARVVQVSDAGGVKVIVVDADIPGRLDFYTRNGFKTLGNDDDLSLDMKVSKARKALIIRAQSS
jgi:ribosomal protein S18 acetylase RimI-like enzyme